MKNVLIVEAKTQMAPVLQPVLETAGFAVRITDRLDGAVAQIGAADVVLVDLEGLKQEGLAIVRAIRALCPNLAVITLNHPKNVDLSIRAMRMGVFEELLLPLNVENLIGSIRKALRRADGHDPKPADAPAATPRQEGEPS